MSYLEEGSDYTKLKLDHFNSIIRMHLKITRNVAIKDSRSDGRYHYFDVTSSSGKVLLLNEQIIDGSPLVFLKAADDLRVRFYANFIDLDCEKIDSLRGNIQAEFPQYNEYHLACQCTDYNYVMGQFMADYNPRMYGVVYLDPYGSKPIDFEMLRLVSENIPRMEVLISIPTRSIKLNSHHWGNIQLGDLLKMIGKQYWLIRERYGRWGWTFLLGTNTDVFDDYKACQLYKINGNGGLGSEIFEEVNEHMKQMSDDRRDELDKRWKIRQSEYEFEYGKSEQLTLFDLLPKGKKKR